MRISAFIVSIFIGICLMILNIMPNSRWIHVIGPSLSILYLYTLDSYWETQTLWPIAGGYIAVVVYFATYMNFMVLVTYLVACAISLADSIVTYISASRDCTSSFKDRCFRNFLLDLSVLNIAIQTTLNYFAVLWWVGLCVNIGFVIYFVLVNTQLREGLLVKVGMGIDLQNNEEQEQLFGINDDGIYLNE